MRGERLNRGLSLIEVVFSLSMLALVTLLVINLFPSSMVTVKQAEYKLQANLLAESALAELAADRFENLVVGAPPVQTTERVDHVDYTVETEVLTAPGQNPDFIRNVRATVRWRIKDKNHQMTRELWVADSKR